MIPVIHWLSSDVTRYSSNENNAGNRLILNTKTGGYNMNIENKLIETSRTDEVKVGQTRATKDMETVVLIIKAPLALGEGEEDAYSSVILPKNENEVFPFELDNEYDSESAETILQLFPVLIDSTLTLKEFYN